MCRKRRAEAADGAEQSGSEDGSSGSGLASDYSPSDSDEPAGAESDSDEFVEESEDELGVNDDADEEMYKVGFP